VWRQVRIPLPDTFEQLCDAATKACPSPLPPLPTLPLRPLLDPPSPLRKSPAIPTTPQAKARPSPLAKARQLLGGQDRASVRADALSLRLTLHSVQASTHARNTRGCSAQRLDFFVAVRFIFDAHTGTPVTSVRPSSRPAPTSAPGLAHICSRTRPHPHSHCTPFSYACNDALARSSMPTQRRTRAQMHARSGAYHGAQRRATQRTLYTVAVRTRWAGSWMGSTTARS
jgi:hypothetical protein